MEPLFADAGDGVRVPLNWFPAGEPRVVLLLMPALGIQARMYTPLATALAAAGCAVAVLEQRGHGRSALRASRGSRIGMAELLDLDIPASLDWLEKRVPGVPVLLGGHSLGGHMSALYAGQHPQRIAGIVQVATPMPYHRDYPRPQGWLIPALCALVSVFRIAPGYFPGHWLGFAGRESLQVMRDWRRWALTGRYDFAGHAGLHDRVGAFRGPVLSIALQRDAYSSPAGIDRALSALPRARVTRLELGPAEQGEFLGHFQWAREPAGVAAAMLAWIERDVMR